MTVPVLLLALLPIQDGLRLPRIFNDHMVLQRETAAPVWGWAHPGEVVLVQGSWMEGPPVRATADQEGRWRAALPTPSAGGPYELTLTGDQGGDPVVVRDVLVGEVWICSGQSNMEWTVGPAGIAGEGVRDWEAEVAAADWPRIRHFDVRNTVSLEPAEDCAGEWKVCSPDTAAAFSACAYFFGREIHRELGVPVGLVSTNWGGTVAEAWTSEEALARLGDFDEPLERIRAARKEPGSIQEQLRRDQEAWWQRLGQVDPLAAEGPSGAASEGWQAGQVPGAWSGDLGRFDGVVWYRREVDLPAEWAGRPLVLELGPIDDMDTTWFNGVKVGGMEGEGRWQTPRVYEVPGDGVKAGVNRLVVRVVDTGGAGGFTGEAGVLRAHPAGEQGDASVSLAGAWSWKRGPSMGELGGWPRRAWFHQNSPTALYNGMLAPLIPYAMRGVIWYQGESNRTRYAQYRYLFPSMIADWRAKWGRGDFPFYFVQIAPYGYGGDTGQAAGLREAQMLALQVPGTGMAVTMDIGNPRDIHPREKQEVGRRLALWALARTYGREGLACSGPLYRSMQVEGSAIRLFFDHTHGGLEARGGPLTHFAIAGRDRVFHPAEAAIEGGEVVVRSDAVAEPVAVRFAWGAADEPNLFNGAGLPASSFRTDDWPAHD